MEGIQFENLNEGLIIVILIGAMIFQQIVRFVAELGKEYFDKRRGNGIGSALHKIEHSMARLDITMRRVEETLGDRPPYPACFYDKEHFRRIERIDDAARVIKEGMAQQEKQIDQGHFHCKLKDDHLRKIERID